MPTYQITAPDGTKWRVNAPDGATQDQVLEYAKSQWGKQKQAAPEVPSGYETQAKEDSFLQNLGASFGGAIAGIPLGLRQLVGNASQDEVNEWSKSMKGLWATPGGKVGSIAGAAAPGIVAGMMPGANTVLGAAIAGAGLGAAAPVEEGQSRINNALLGSVTNAAFPAAVGAWRSVKAAGAPFTQSGREGIAGRALGRYATDPNSLTRAAGVTWQSGAKPTLAEAAADPGLANLQRVVQTMDPRGLISQRFMDNNAARVAALSSIAGDPAKRAAAEAARDASAGQMYRAATNALYTVDDELAGLLKQPNVKQAMERAKVLAANKGRPFAFDVTPANPYSGVGLKTNESRQITGQGLQDLKMAMDEMLSDPGSGFAGKAADALKEQRGKVIAWMEKVNPDFKAARVAYAEASKPINSMDIGQRLLDSKTSALRDFGGNPRMYGEGFAKALRDEDALVKQATGMRSRGLLDVMEPQQMQVLNGIVDELSAHTASQSAGKVAGSPTAQYLVGQDIIGRIAGPLGVPQQAAGSALAQTALSRPASFLLKTPEEEVIGLLAEAMLDPKKAAELLKKGKPSALARNAQLLIDRSMPVVNGTATGVALLPAQ